jgi:hypothetical protein
VDDLLFVARIDTYDAVNRKSCDVTKSVVSRVASTKEEKPLVGDRVVI